MTDLIRLERSGPNDAVARVTLARPEVHNAFDASLIAELRVTFAALAREAPTDLRAVVLAGDGPSFCAGADIDWMRAAMQLDVEGNEQDAMAMADMLEAIDTCPVPVIARVQGAGARRRHGAVRRRGPRHRRGGREVRVHRDAARDPAGGDLAVRDRQDRRDATPGRCSRAGAGSTRSAPSGSGWSTRSSKGIEALDAAVDQAVADILASGPTAVRAAKAIVREVRGLGPRVGEMAHGPGDRAAARLAPRPRKGSARSPRSAVRPGRRTG